jgi:hypothetical protein
MIRWLHVIGILSSLLLIIGCDSQSVPLRETQVIDGLAITLETLERPQMNTAVDFIVVLQDDQGNPVSDANVYLDLDMPAMPMGITRPVAVPEGSGRYWARTAYTMEGLWEITVVVELA